MNDKPSRTYTLRPARPPRYVIAGDLLLLANAGILYGLGRDWIALAHLTAWAVGTALIVVLVARDVLRNRRIASALEARGYVRMPWQNEEKR